MSGSSKPLGLESGAVYIRPYDEVWTDLYEAEVVRIESVLSAEGIILAFEHTGSTAVAGMPAKPVIDILAGMSGVTIRERAIAAVQVAGYVYRVDQEIETRDFFGAECLGNTIYISPA